LRVENRSGTWPVCSAGAGTRWRPAIRARTGLDWMTAIVAKNIDGNRGNSGHCGFVFIQFAGHEASFASALVPRRMLVVAEDEFCADAGGFAACPRGLRVAQVGKELRGSLQIVTVGCVCRKFQRVQNLAARCQQPAQSIGHGKVTPCRCPWYNLPPSGSRAFCRCFSDHNHRVMAVASVQAPVSDGPRRSVASLQSRYGIEPGKARSSWSRSTAAVAQPRGPRRSPPTANPSTCWPETLDNLRDAVAAHQAHRFAHHVGPMTGVPELGRGAQHVGLGILQHKLNQRIGLQLGSSRRTGFKSQQLDCLRFAFA